MYFSKKLKRFKNINHCFFSRKGGFSKGIYESLNCGQGSKDKKSYINKNLNFVSKKIKIDKKKLALMYQTHSKKVIIINNKNKNLKKFKSDALVTKIQGIALGVVTADCVPIILFDPQNHIIGCIHAGWKGALKERTPCLPELHISRTEHFTKREVPLRMMMMMMTRLADKDPSHDLPSCC